MCIYICACVYIMYLYNEQIYPLSTLAREGRDKTLNILSINKKPKEHSGPGDKKQPFGYSCVPLNLEKCPQ